MGNKWKIVLLAGAMITASCAPNAHFYGSGGGYYPVTGVTYYNGQKMPQATTEGDITEQPAPFNYLTYYYSPQNPPPYSNYVSYDYSSYYKPHPLDDRPYMAYPYYPYPHYRYYREVTTTGNYTGHYRGSMVFIPDTSRQN